MPRKNKSSKRFGARYGSKIRRNVDKAESRDEDCPECSGKLERTAAGVWTCRKCGTKFAGGAYSMDTGAQEQLQKALRVGTEELEAAQEVIEEEGETE